MNFKDKYEAHMLKKNVFTSTDQRPDTLLLFNLFFS